MTWAEVHYERGMEANVITLLLSLADDPKHVRTQGPRGHVLVPNYLADRYSDATKPKPRRQRRKKEEESEEA